MLITSKDNELIREIVKLNGSAKERRERHLFIAEGIRLCRDALLSGARIVRFLYTAEAAEKNAADYAAISAAAEKSVELSRSLMEKVSDTNTPQGFLCVIDTCLAQSFSALEKGKKYVALENIQDPSNLGTILRTAEALGADGVILSSGCCDVFSPKVVRGSMGAVFRQPIMLTGNLSILIKSAGEQGIVSYASTPHDAKDLEEIDFSAGGMMLIGNEGNGLTEETIQVCTERVRIPMKGRAESLNAAAAAAILMYAFI